MIRANPQTYRLYSEVAFEVLRRFGVFNSTIISLRFFLTRIQFRLRVLRPWFSPPNYYLFMTKRCNLSCSFCHYHGELDDKNSLDHDWEWKLEDLREFEQKGILKPYSKVCLYGGEPMLNNEFFKCVKYLNENNYLSSTITNASLITPKIEELIKNPLHQMTISYYKGIADKHVDALQRLSKYTLLNVSYIISQESYHLTEEVVLFSIKIGAKFITIENLVAKESCSKKPVISHDEYLSFKKEMIQKYSSQIIFRWSDVSGRGEPGSVINCSEPWDTILIDKKGRSLPCCQYPLESFEGDDSTAKPFLSKSLIEIRRKMKKNEIPKNCEGCHYLHAKDPLYNLRG